VEAGAGEVTSLPLRKSAIVLDEGGNLADRWIRPRSTSARDEAGEEGQADRVAPGRLPQAGRRGFGAAFFAFFLHLGQAGLPSGSGNQPIQQTGAVQTMHRPEFRGMALAMLAHAYHRLDLP